MTSRRPPVEESSQQKEMSSLRRWFGFTARADNRWIGGAPPAFGFEISNPHQPLDLSQPELAQGVNVIREMIRVRAAKSEPLILVHEHSITIAAQLIQASKIDERDVFARHAWGQGVQTAALLFSLLSARRIEPLLRPELRAGLLPGLDASGRPLLTKQAVPFILLAQGRNNFVSHVDLVDIPTVLAQALSDYRSARGRPASP